jgi:hypothetical protein
VNAPDRRKKPRVTDRYRETTDRAARVIDEARLLRLEIGAEEDPGSEIRALQQILEKQVARYPNGPRESGRARNK